VATVIHLSMSMNHNGLWEAAASRVTEEVSHFSIESEQYCTDIAAQRWDSSSTQSSAL
jgi:hypothetical protein